MPNNSITPDKKNQILSLISQGINTKEIAKQTKSSVNTIKKIKKGEKINVRGDDLIKKSENENVIHAERSIIIKLDLTIQITKFPEEDILIELWYGKSEPFNITEKDAIDKILDIIDGTLKTRNLCITDKRDLQYQGIKFPSQFRCKLKKIEETKTSEAENE